MKRSPMRMRNGLVGISALLLALSAGGPIASAEDPVTPGDDEPTPAEEPLPLPEPDAPAPEKKKLPFGLYVAVGVGEGSGDEFDMSIVRDQAMSQADLEFDSVSLGFASVGWKLPEEKGDFRLTFRGNKEEEYSFHAVGRLPQSGGPGGGLGSVNVDCAEGGPDNLAPCLVPWWVVDAVNGHLRSVRTPSTWTIADDANVNGLIDPGEVQFQAPDRIIDLDVPNSLQNQLQTFDLMYGREFGARRVSSRWWAGVRYYAYDGNLLAGAWLVPPGFQGQSGLGEGFTDGTTLRLLNISQDASGFGPTGSWEVDVNFFNKGLVLYARAQAALTLSKLESDTGPFFTVIQEAGTTNTFFLPARMTESRDKSSWHNTAEAGVRVRMQKGLEFEVAYSLTGYLDVLLTPSSLAVPLGTAQSQDGVSGLYSTQDFVVSAWHASVGFQF